MVELKKQVIEEFKNDGIEVQGACVVDFLKRQLNGAFDTGWYENNMLDEESEKLKQAFITVLNFVADTTDNEEMRVEDDDCEEE